MKKHKKKKFKPTKKEDRKRSHIYRELSDRPEIPESDYDQEAYEFFKSVKWDAAWKEFLEYDDEGAFKYKTVWSLIKKITGTGKDAKEQATWMWASIGPKDKKNKKMIVPYIGDWGYMRSSLFIGEVNKESLLFGNPKVTAVRELVKNHLDVLEVSKGFGDILMGWLARYDTWATQIDERFKYNLFDPKLSDEKNERRFAQYTKMQEYIFNRVVDCTRQVLRCFGIGKDDLSILTQLMITSMKDRLGNSTAQMMMAAASGIKIIEGGQLPESGTAVPGDRQVIDGYNEAFQKNPVLSQFLGTFMTKSKLYNQEQPDMELEGVDKDDTRTDPAKDPPKILNGKHSNGKAKVQ